MNGTDKVDEELAAGGRHEPRRVEPDKTDGAVAGEEFADLRQRFLAQVTVEVFLRIRPEIPVVAGAVGVVPVLRLGIVEAQ